MAHRQWPALSTETLAGPSDHMVVTYTFEARAPMLRRGPRCRALREDLSPEALEAMSEEWDDATFSAACNAGDLDRAWQVLSDWGEDLLCDHDPEAVPRSAPWTPSVPPIRRTGKQPERSAGLRALLKLLSRIDVCVARPFDAPLWNRITKSLANVRRLVPELPHITMADEATVARVEALVQVYFDQEREAAKKVWKRVTCISLSASRAYVKGKADQILEWEKNGGRRASSHQWAPPCGGSRQASPAAEAEVEHPVLGFGAVPGCRWHSIADSEAPSY